jgi:hypothetical protein
MREKAFFLGLTFFWRIYVRCARAWKQALFAFFLALPCLSAGSFRNLVGFAIFQADAKEKPKTRHASLPQGSKDVSFRKVLPFEFVYPSTPTSELPNLERLVVVACRNEFEPGTFAIWSRRNLSNVTVEVTDLRTKDRSVFPDGQIRVFVVKVWEQVLGRAQFRDVSDGDMPRIFEEFRTPVPELLVTDDLTEPEERWDVQTVANGRVSYKYVPPSFPDKTQTELKSGETKQFWLVFRVPETQQGGIYEGQVLVKSNSKMVASLPVELIVLPVSLVPPDKITGVYFRSTLGEDGYFFVPEDQYRSQLEFLKSLGIESLTIYDQKYSDLEKAFRIAREIGFKGPIVQMDVPEDEDEAKKRVELAERFGYEAFFYGEDEPGLKTMARHIHLAQRIRKAGGKVVTAIAKNMMRFLEEKIDWANISQIYIPIGNPSEGFIGTPEFTHQKEASGSPEIYTHYWQCWQEKPLLNRVLTGFYLYRSNLDGFMCFCTYAFQVGLPFHQDLRVFEGRKGQVLKVFNLFYPSAKGVVPTLQSEGLREGIDDLRYTQTVKKLIEKVAPSMWGEMLLRLNDVLQVFSYRAIRDFRLRPEDFYKARLSLVRLIAEIAQGVPSDVQKRVFDFASEEASIKTLTHLPPYGNIVVSPSNGFRVEDTSIQPYQEEVKGKAGHLVLDNKSVLLIRFDLPRLPEGVRVEKAIMSLFVVSSSGKGAISATVHEVLSEWQEDEATWTMRSANMPWRTKGGDYNAQPKSPVTLTEEIYKRYEWDVTGIVKAWIEGGARNYGFAIVVREGQGGRVFVSAQHENFQFLDERPSLSITYRQKSGERLLLWTRSRGKAHLR